MICDIKPECFGSGGGGVTGADGVCAAARSNAAQDWAVGTGKNRDEAGDCGSTPWSWVGYGGQR